MQGTNIDLFCHTFIDNEKSFVTLTPGPQAAEHFSIDCVTASHLHRSASLDDAVDITENVKLLSISYSSSCFSQW
jgi:hypothetical protein